MEGLNILKSNRFNQDILLGIYEHYRKCIINGKSMKVNEQQEIFKFSVNEVKNFCIKLPVNRKDKNFPGILFNLNKIMDKLKIEEKDRYLIIMLKNTDETTLMDIYSFLEEHFLEIRSFQETWEIMISLRKMFLWGSIFCPVF